MKRKRNHSLRSSVFIFLAALFLLFTCSVSTIYASTLQKPDIAASGKFVKDGDYWIYRYDDKTIAKNVFLKIDKKTYYFNKLGHRWCSWHTIKGKNYYFGTRSQGYLIKNSLIKYKGNYYYVGKDGAMVTGWYTDKSGKKYYFGKDGKAVTGKHKIKGTYYYFNQNGTVTHTGLNYSLSSDCALLMNADTGQIIYGKNENVAHANASTTKIMTCILALENCKLNEKVKFSPYAASIEPSKLYANAGEIFYLKDLLYSLMLPSHNDTAVAIAEHVSGSTAKFVKLMNKRAQELGMTNTTFKNCNGLPEEGHVTTARDISIMSLELLKHPTILKYSGTYMETISEGRKSPIELVNHNKLVRFFDGCDGLKTGFTQEAKYCISATAVRNNVRMLAVIMGAPTYKVRNRDASMLMNYGFSKYQGKKLFNKDDDVETVYLGKSEDRYYVAKAKDDLSIVFLKGSEGEPQNKIILNEPKDSYTEGEIVGKCEVYLDGQKVGEVELYCDRDVEKGGFIDNLKYNMKNLFKKGV